MSNRFICVISLGFLAACAGGANTVVPPRQGDTVTTPVSEVQGNSSASPLNGQVVTVRGIVSGDFQEADTNTDSNLGGFFIYDVNPDDDATTSDGIFVFDGNAPATDVIAGDRVSVAGTVTEHFGETQIVATEVRVEGTGDVRPTIVELPVAEFRTNSDGESIPDLEHLEGMLVQFPQTMVVADLYDLERFGSVRLTAERRAFQFTNSNEPDIGAFDADAMLFARSIIELDDGLTIQNASPIRFLNPDPDDQPDFSLRAGDTVTRLIGNVRYSRGSGGQGRETYRVMPTGVPVFSAQNPRPLLPPGTGGNLTVASFNVLNYFATLDSGQDVCGPAGDQGCRGADSQAEFERQHAKTVTALSLLDADIVGLMELQNDATQSLRSIVDELNRHAPADSWAFVATGTVGDDAIKVGFIYKASSVSVVGAPAILDSGVDSRFLDSRNRPSIAQTFELDSNNARITVVVNHLKSKGSPCADIGDPDLRDGQGNCNLTRSGAAAALVDWLAGDPTGSGDSDVLIIGDLNAYLREDPLAILTASGYVNLLDSALAGDAYSFLFRGRIGALDHALVSASLSVQVSAVAEWHINADEPPVFDYNLEHGRDPSLFDGSAPYRASDHDPVLIGLQLDPD